MNIMNTTLVSVIITTYNIRDFIDECLESVSSQNYTNLEVLVIDDCSSDATPELIHRWEKKDSRIRFFQNPENRGPGGARNKGLEESSGEYILFVDGDDLIRPDCIERLLLRMDAETDLILYNGISFTYPEGKWADRNYFYIPPTYFSPEGNLKEENYCLTGYHQPCMKFYRSSFLKRNGIKFPCYIYGEDVEFWLRCLLKATHIKYLDYQGYCRRYRPGSVMTGGSLKNLYDRIDNFAALLDISKDHTGFYNYFVGKYIPDLYSHIQDKKDPALKEYWENTLSKLSEIYD